MSWLKLTLKGLGLKRRGNTNTVKVIVTKLLRSSHNLRGYRSVWKYIRDSYKMVVRRYIYMNPV